jgi:hypothetical protein
MTGTGRGARRRRRVSAASRWRIALDAHRLSDDYLHRREGRRRSGGTWRDNTYPGAACDVPSHLYSLSFAAECGLVAPVSASGRRFAAHLEQVCPAMDRSRASVRFGWTVAAQCEWQSPTRVRWRVDEHARASVIEARCVVAAMGGLHVPNWPDIPGRDSRLPARPCHSARWDHSASPSRASACRRDRHRHERDPGDPGAGTRSAADACRCSSARRCGCCRARTAAIPNLAATAVRAGLPPLRLAVRGALYLQLEALSLALAPKPKHGVLGQGAGWRCATCARQVA